MANETKWETVNWPKACVFCKAPINTGAMCLVHAGWIVCPECVEVIRCCSEHFGEACQRRGADSGDHGKVPEWLL